MIRRRSRTLEYRADADGAFTVFSLPWEAIVYDQDTGRQVVKDRIDDRREELAMLATCRIDAEQVIYDADDRAAVARKITKGMPII